MNLDDAQERSANAGEYVLGTLGADERAALERALATDAALQAEVYAWQDRLAGLGARIAPSGDPPPTWARIEPGLRPVAAAAPAPHNDSPAANDPLRQRIRRWQATSAVALAACLLMAVLLVTRAPVEHGGERYLAVLQAPDRSTGWVVEGQAGGTLRLVQVGTMPPVPAGKSLQFWTKPDGAAGPTSLGLVQAGQSVELSASRLPGLGDKQLFELTLEPEGGSPIDRPTGTVLYIGTTVRL